MDVMEQIVEERGELNFLPKVGRCRLARWDPR